MMSIFRKAIAFFAVVALPLSFVSCDKGEEGAFGQESLSGERVEMTFGLSTPDMVSPVVTLPLAAAESSADAACTLAFGQTAGATTRAAAGTAAENTLSGLWVLQFDGNTSASKLVLREYYTQSDIQNNQISVPLVAATLTRVYFVGNVSNSQFSSLALSSTTLGTFEGMAQSIAAATSVATAGLPMVGVYEGSAAAATATVSLQRMVARIDFTCTVDLYSASESFAVTSVQLKSASTKTAYKAPTVPTAQSGLYPDGSQSANFADLTAVSASGSTLTHTWYVAENLRGVKTGLTDKTKGGDNVPAGSTCIEVAGRYTQGGKTFDVVYQIFPGQNSSTDFNLIRNHIYTISSAIKGINESDLRVIVSKAEELSVSGTANCYMVSQAGTDYKFNATVMGNGKSTPAATSPATGAAITPSTLAPASAKVLWETGSKGSVIASVSLDNGEVTFTTAGTSGNTVAEGNAVIGVFNSSGTLIWSWHIWATKYDPATSYDTYSTGYKVMQYNLGADATSAVGTVGRFGLLYQWGRKDPFIGSSATSGTTLATTANDGSYAWANEAASKVGTAQITYSIQNPTKFLYRSSSPYDWVSSDTAGQLDNLWGNPNVIDGTNTAKGSKSIYDPCPPGWRVPPQDTWTGFTSTGGNTSTSSQFNVSGSFNVGWNFYIGGSKSGTTTFYPASGCRYYSSGALSSVGSNGYNWSSSPYSRSSYYAGPLSFYTSNVGPLRNYTRADGFSVRCVQA